MSQKRRFLVLLICAAAHLPLVASADDWAVVTVNHCNELSGGEPARAFRKALSRHQSLYIQTEASTARLLGGRVGGSIDEAERLIESARVDFIAASTDRAEKEISDATELLASLPPSPKRWADYKEARTLAAWFFLHRGAREAAESALREILIAEPDFRPSAASYPPKVGALAQLLRAALRKAPVQELEVQSEPAGLPIYVDFHLVGNAPLKTKLPAGAYRVEAAFPKARGLPVRVELGDERVSVTLKSSFHGAISSSHGPCIMTGGARAETLGVLTKLATTLNVQRLVAVELDEPVTGEQYLSAALVDSAKGEEIRAARVKIAPGTSASPATKDLAEFIATGRAVENMQVVVNPGSEPVVIASPVATKPPPPPTEVAREAPTNGIRPMRVASFVAGGLGVAGMALGTVELVARNSAVNDANNQFTSANAGNAAAQGAFRSAISRKNSATMLATVGFAAGGAALASGVMLYILSGNESGTTVAVDVHDRFQGLIIAGRF